MASKTSESRRSYMKFRTKLAIAIAVLKDSFSAAWAVLEKPLTDGQQVAIWKVISAGLCVFLDLWDYGFSLSNVLVLVYW